MSNLQDWTATAGGGRRAEEIISSHLWDVFLSYPPFFLFVCSYVYKNVLFLACIITFFTWRLTMWIISSLLSIVLYSLRILWVHYLYHVIKGQQRPLSKDMRKFLTELVAGLAHMHMTANYMVVLGLTHELAFILTLRGEGCPKTLHVFSCWK